MRFVNSSTLLQGFTKAERVSRKVKKQLMEILSFDAVCVCVCVCDIGGLRGWAVVSMIWENCWFWDCLLYDRSFRIALGRRPSKHWRRVTATGRERF